MLRSTSHSWSLIYFRRSKAMNLSLVRTAVIVCGLVAAASSRIDAATVTLGASKDNTMFQSTTGDISNGAGPHLFIGTNDQGNERRALVAFDLAGAIPAGSTINAATLTLN